MSDYEELRERLDWLVSAVKVLLERETAKWHSVPDLEGTVTVMGEVERPPSDTPDVQTERVPENQCLHNVQTIVDGYPTCGKCGKRLGPKSGVVGRTISQAEAVWNPRGGPTE
jgi:hypothetical protein